MTYPMGMLQNKILKMFMILGEQKQGSFKLRTEIGWVVKHTSTNITSMMLSLVAFTKFVHNRQSPVAGDFMLHVTFV